MADVDLQKAFRRQLNEYQLVEQWLGNRLRRRAKAQDWLRNSLVRRIVTEEPAAGLFNDLLRAANPPSNRVDYFRGIFDVLPGGNTSGAEFDLTLDQVEALIRTCAFLQSTPRRSVRRVPESYAVPDFFVVDDRGDLLVQCVNMRTYLREVANLANAIAAHRITHPDFANAGFTAYGVDEYLSERFEQRRDWQEKSARLIFGLDDQTVLEAMSLAQSQGTSVIGGALGIVAGDQGVRVAMTAPDASAPAASHPFFRALRLEISTAVGWMHNHALANDMHARYLIFVDATGIDDGLPQLGDLRTQVDQYMSLMWDTNPTVSLYLASGAGDFDIPAPGAPMTAM